VCSILYDQLYQWILYGSLSDQHGEFFLQLGEQNDQVCIPTVKYDETFKMVTKFHKNIEKYHKLLKNINSNFYLNF